MTPRRSVKSRPSASPSTPRFLTWLREYAELIFLALFLVFVTSLFLFYINTPRNTFASTPYSDLLFNDSIVHRIEVEMSLTDRDLQLSAPEAKNKYLASVKIDGEEYKNVAFSTRGNASLSTLAADPDNIKYSYKLSFSRYDEQQTYHGLDKLVLGSFYSDASYLREYLAYTIMREAGVPTPLISFTELVINGEPAGLYLAIEDIDRSFLNRNGAAPSAVLFKPESAFHNASARRRFDETDRLSDIAIFNEDDTVTPFYHGADLVYRGDSAAEYSDIFDNAVTKFSPQDEKYIISCIKSLAPVAASDLSASDTVPSVSSCWNYFALARYSAAHNFIINRDSYIGSIPHNYYLLLDQQQLSLLPWDYNYAFLGFTVDGEELTEIPEETSILTPSLGVPDSDRPLWAYLKSDPDFLALYLETYETLLSKYLDNGLLSDKIDSTSRLIRRHVAADPTRSVDLSEYDDAVAYLKDFIHARALSVQHQLWEIKKSALEPDSTETEELSTITSNQEKVPSEGDLEEVLTELKSDGAAPASYSDDSSSSLDFI